MIDDAAQRLLKSSLPAHWVVRDYKPDYGIDLAVELFEPNGSGSYDTLGEHVFIQLKGTQALKTRTLTIDSRLNVEKHALSGPQPSTGSSVKIEVISFPLEASELVTVQRMGSSLPVLLTIADTTADRVFFVCLNDYIDKILRPEDPQYATKKTKTIYVPTANELTLGKRSLVPLLFYAKRPKLYAAFQKFSFQEKELRYTTNRELRARTKHFADILLGLDLWTPCSWWTPIGTAHRQLKALISTGSPGKMTSRNEQLPNELQNGTFSDEFDDEWSLEEMQRFQEIRTVWKQLANLGSIHEDVCREWFLPTFLGVQCS